MQILVANNCWLLLLKASWQAAVLILIVLALQYLLGSRLTPRWRFRLWLLVAVRLALPWTVPSTVSLFNILRFSGVPEATASAPEAALGPAAPVTQPTQPGSSSVSTRPALASPESSSDTQWRMRRGHQVGSAAGLQTTSASLLDSPPRQQTVPDWKTRWIGCAWNLTLRPAWLPLLWAAGASAFALGLGLNHIRFHRKVAGSTPLLDITALHLLQQCKARMGIRTPVSLVETTAVAGPALFGFLRPRILLPPGFTRSFSHDELRFVFLHELGHVKRHDILLGWLTALLQVTHWFNPLVWLAFARMRVDRELACDAMALSYTAHDEHKPYGRTIIKLLEHFGDSLRAPSLAGIVEDRNQLKERIGMIAKFHQKDRGFAVAICLFTGLALVSLTDAQNTAKTPESSPQPAQAKAQSTKAKNGWDLQEKIKMAETGNTWAVYDLWDAYYRGHHGVQADRDQADKWLGQLVQDLWVVRFEPIDDFAPTNPGEFLGRINQHSSCRSGRTNIGAASFFRTTVQGDKLVGSFLSIYPDKLKDSLSNVPGLKVVSTDRVTPQEFVKYEQSPQESLWSLQQKTKLAEAGNKWAAYDLWDAYYRGHHGVQSDRTKADQWLAEVVQDLWVVRFEPVDDFEPQNPGEFLGRIDQYSSARSGRTDIGAASFFRTTKQGNQLVGSFLSNVPDQLKASLAKVPGVKVTSVERMPAEKFVSYEESPQQSLNDLPSAENSPKGAAEPSLAPPKIIATSPSVGAADVDPALTEITVTFDQDMTGGMSWTGAGPEFPPGLKGQKAHWRDKRTCCLPVKLESAHYYRVGINSTSYQNFKNAQGLPALCSAIFFTTQGASEQLKARTVVPKVVRCNPDNGAQNVSPTVTEVRVTFTAPMGGGFSWCTAGDDDSDFPKGVDGKGAYWTDDKKTCALPVSLKPGMTYRLSLNAPGYVNFQTDAGVPLEPVAYTFKTAD